MIDDVVVVDAVLHGCNFEAYKHVGPPGQVYNGLVVPLSPPHLKYKHYLLSREQFEHKFTAKEIVSCVFAESSTDIGVYHHVRHLEGARASVVPEELSPLSVGLEVRQLAPGRVLIYGAVTDPFDPKRSIDDIDRLVADHGIVGLKFYPTDWNSSTLREEPYLLDDEDVAYPILEHAEKRGLIVAVHKAMGSRLHSFGVGDLEAPCLAFPNLKFEIVHAGYAFLEDMVMMATLPNVYLNLEATTGLLGVAPRRFAEIIGRFIDPREGRAEDRLIWATGAVFVHPQPALELFWNFEMPEDLVSEYGFPQVTREIKRKILGENFARMLGVDLDQLMRAIPNDEMRKAQLAGKLAPPWSQVSVLA